MTTDRDFLEALALGAYEPDPRDEHDAWHRWQVEGCDACDDRAAEDAARLPDLHVNLYLEVRDR